MTLADDDVRVHLAPRKIAPGTHLIQDVQHALGQPLSVYLNSMVIQGAEPIIVDTGSARNREAWLQDVFGLVEPQDVRWVFLTHDDSDHTGNLAQVMDACPNATLVCSWTLVERFANAYDFDLNRCRWVNDGESFDAGDRTLVAVRPPVYDSPATRGLFDTSTGVYWAADAFASPVPGGPGASPVGDVADLDPEAWWGGMVMFGLHALSPWLSMVQKKKYARCVRQVRAHGMTTIASGHSAVISGASVAQAFDMLGNLAGAEPPPCPDQAVLEMMLRAMGGE
ncbi:oxygen-binding di-iron domain-containing protein [Pseudonocardia bannensis]|uniref:MBL fold metallo-hydrolase n=1 Tax=Pseudonocardia bannensis TaxID=630973 RepID=A0A848DDT1_9PSEU|nr:MBL fold metallo-hydrolase [Pseudonocardia bannensis]NMH90759.1 MBL fold metallo-hydrolase [Pseudonocardia bannensis]